MSVLAATRKAHMEYEAKVIEEEAEAEAKKQHALIGCVVDADKKYPDFLIEVGDAMLEVVPKNGRCWTRVHVAMDDMATELAHCLIKLAREDKEHFDGVYFSVHHGDRGVVNIEVTWDL